MTVRVSEKVRVSDRFQWGSGIIPPVTDMSGTFFVSRQRAVNLYAYPVSVTRTGNSRLTAFCIGDKMRFCIKCWTEKDESEFRKSTRGYDDFETACKQCRPKQKSSPEKKREYKRNRRARNYGDDGKISNKEWQQLKERYDFTCLRCGRKEPEIKLELDHIVPLIVGGSNTIGNSQPLCHSCNASKGKKHDDFR